VRLVLASASPRRRALLARLGVAFAVVPSDVDETLPPDLPPDHGATELARRKARAVAARLGGTGVPAVVLAADTLVVLDGQPFGKPASRTDARRMLRALRGRTHEVVTGLAVVETATGHETVEMVVSRVHMREFGDAELEAYLLSGEPDDKAGAYAVQGVGGRLVARVEGCYTNVVGLPVRTTARLLRLAGLTVADPAEPGPPPTGPAGSGPGSPGLS
jgi:septum formation protein